MLNTDQEILNQIARTQEMASYGMKEIFLASQEEADELEEIHYNKIDKVVIELGYKNLMNGRLASRIWDVLPLFIEHKAISKYIIANNAFHLRNALPEIQTPKEAAQLMRMENHMMTEEELEAAVVIFEQLQKKLSSNKMTRKEKMKMIFKAAKRMNKTPEETLINFLESKGKKIDPEIKREMLSRKPKDKK